MYPEACEQADKEYDADLARWYDFLAQTYGMDRAAWERLEATASQSLDFTNGSYRRYILALARMIADMR
jgi:hypothetical protein